MRKNWELNFLNKMTQELLDHFEEYSPGAILNLTLDRGQGEHGGTYTFYGIDVFDGKPLLVHSSYFERKRFIRKVVFLDTSKVDIERVHRKSGKN